MQINLIRKYGSAGTNGYLIVDGELICKTIELPWRNNKPSVSCIPEDTYVIAERYSPRFGRHLHVLNVPHRSFILFHPANDALRELRGCIAPVTQWTGQGRGTQSKMAMRKLLERLTPFMERKEVITLNIIT